MKKSNLDTQVQYLKGVGPQLAKILKKLNIITIKDLIYTFPRSYEDRRNIKKIGTISSFGEVIIKGKIEEVKTERTKRGFSIIKAVISDETGNLVAVWFNQPFITRVLKKNSPILISGTLEQNFYSKSAELKVRDYELIKEGEKVDKIVPIYNLTEGLYQKKVRSIIALALNTYIETILDHLPIAIKQKFKLMDLQSAIMVMHEPADDEKAHLARYRLVFDEFFVFQLGLGLRKKSFTDDLKGIKFKKDGQLEEKFLSSLPFKLTGAQEKVLSEIKQDLVSGRPMGRLLQGDVGSGKTIIATLAMLLAFENGYQSALMAPTEILASQHYQKIEKMLSTFNIKTKLLTGSIKRSEKEKIFKELENNKINILIGTHALIEDEVKFNKLGLVIIDEQHRFGVLQRTKLKQKGMLNPHLLAMTATPIPRTLALTIYGDMDRSVIDELPPGRTPVKTYFVPEEKREASYKFMKEKMKEGRQVFVICPLIEESEVLDLKAAKEEYEKLKEIFSEFNVGLLHGRMPAEEKDRVMNEFKIGTINMLVSTTVIEVGIDIPNASIMVIEHSERFGLSQLHQLRGRIGRGSHESFCFLFSDPKTPEAKTRIAAMLKSNDGFYLAEVDLKIRGPGEFYGIRQSGLPEFRIADIIIDTDILLIARKAAFELLGEDPGLEKDENRFLREELLARHGKNLELGMLD